MELAIADAKICQDKWITIEMTKMQVMLNSIVRVEHCVGGRAVVMGTHVWNGTGD